MHDRSAGELWEAIGSLVVGEQPLEEVCRRAAIVATALLEPVVAASVTFLSAGNRAWTVASSDDVALVLDDAQYAAGRGPCVDAALGGTAVLVRDLLRDERWPELADRAAASGVRASLSAPLPLQHDATAALNCYADTVDPFTDDLVRRAGDVAAQVAVAVLNAVRYDEAASLAEQLREAMASRATIEQAKGIVMTTRGCSPDEAFDLLVAQSQQEQRKLREVAAHLVEQQWRRPPSAAR